MDYVINTSAVASTSYPRFGIGSSTDTLYVQARPVTQWVSLDIECIDCENWADIVPLPIGTTITFTQD